MEEKYVLNESYEGMPKGTEIMRFHGFYYVNGGMVPPSYNGMLESLISDPSKTTKMKIIQNKNMIISQQNGSKIDLTIFCSEWLNNDNFNYI